MVWRIFCRRSPIASARSRPGLGSAPCRGSSKPRTVAWPRNGSRRAPSAVSPAMPSWTNPCRTNRWIGAAARAGLPRRAFELGMVTVNRLLRMSACGGAGGPSRRGDGRPRPGLDQAPPGPATGFRAVSKNAYNAKELSGLPCKKTPAHIYCTIGSCARPGAMPISRG